MSELPIHLGFLLAGLAASLHCIGMCGPIYAAMTTVLPVESVTVEGRRAAGNARRISLDLLWLHSGRLTTYAMLGVIAGQIGAIAHRLDWISRGQHWAGLVIAATAIVFGVGLALAPSIDCSGENGGPIVRSVRRLYSALRAERSPLARYLAGAVFGFLPCGVVYAMMALAAATGDPLEAAGAMALFGLGTIPGLSSAVIAAGLLPIRLRRHGALVVAALVILVGGLMMWRSWPDPDHPEKCPMCDPAS